MALILLCISWQKLLSIFDHAVSGNFLYTVTGIFNDVCAHGFLSRCYRNFALMACMKISVIFYSAIHKSLVVFVNKDLCEVQQKFMNEVLTMAVKDFYATVTEIHARKQHQGFLLTCIENFSKLCIRLWIKPSVSLAHKSSTAFMLKDFYWSVQKTTLMFASKDFYCGGQKILSKGIDEDCRLFLSVYA